LKTPFELRRSLLVCVALCCVAQLAVAGQNVILVVTTPADDAGIATNCTPQSVPATGTDSACSLRDALAFASLGAAQSNSISFDSTIFSATNTIAANTITLTNGTLNIPSNTNMGGPTAGAGATQVNLVTVSGNNASTVFTVIPGATSVVLAGLNIVGGNAVQGGGINNAGTLMLSNSTVSGNSATSITSGVSTGGGGIFNSGTLTAQNSTVSGNSATAAGASSMGGGVDNSGYLTLINSTIAGNSVTAGGAGFGGGIFTTGATGSNLSLVHSTISGNAADGEGGGIFSNTAVGTEASAPKPHGQLQTEGSGGIGSGAFPGAHGRTGKGNSDPLWKSSTTSSSQSDIDSAASLEMDNGSDQDSLTLQTLGDSITFGAQSSACPAPYNSPAPLASSTCFAGLVAINRGLTLTDLAIPAAEAIDISATQIYGYTASIRNYGQFTSSALSIATLLVGVTDNGYVNNETKPYFNGTRSVTEWQMIHEDMTGFMLTPNKLAANSTSCTASSGWTASTFWTVGGMQTSTNGATITCPILGSSAYISVMAQVGNLSTISIAVDNGPAVRYPYALSAPSFLLGNTNAGELFRIPNLLSNNPSIPAISAPHTITITANVSGSSPVFLNWIDGNGNEQSDGAGPVVFALSPYLSEAETDANGRLPNFRRMLAAEASDLKSDGLNEVVGDLSIPCTAIPITNPPVSLCDTFDGTHPTDAGHAIIAAYVEQLFNNNVDVANSVVSGNTATLGPDTNDIYNDNGGNQISVAGIGLSPLGNFGGSTETMLPLPGSAAICSGTAANTEGLLTDQRGFSRTTSYNGQTCVDSGAVQTNYGLIFSAEPPSTVDAETAITPAPVVGLTESGSAASTATNSVSVTDSAGLILPGTTSVNLSSGFATFNNVVIPSAIANDILQASLALTPSLNLTAQSSQFQVVPVPVVTLWPTSESFGAVGMGTTSGTQTVTMTNTGTAALSISSIAITGASASSFVFGNTCGTSLAVGANCIVHGHFAPTVAGALTASIVITDNAGNSPQSIALSGAGVATAAASLSATSLSFGSVNVGNASGSQTVTLTNTGDLALSIASIGVTGTNASSFVFANGCGTSLAAGTSCTIHGHFGPMTSGALTAAITITDNAVGSTQSIALSGTGVDAATVSLSATNLSFGSVNVGGSSGSQTVTLTNTGDLALSIASIGVTGTNASSFVFANGCGTSLAAGTSCTIHGHFGPMTSGALTAAITITDNAVGSTQSIALSGTGVDAATVSLSATNLSFGSVNVGGSSGSQTVTLKNTGDLALSIASIGVTGTNASSFVFANGCGTSLAAGANCTIHGHFAPVAVGSQTATIMVVDNASNSPQSISLSGTGQ